MNRMMLVAVCVFVAACGGDPFEASWQPGVGGTGGAQGGTGGTAGQGGTGGTAGQGGTGGTAGQGGTGGMAGQGGTGGMAGQGGTAGAGCHLVINEVRPATEGDAWSGWVEIYNPCDESQPLEGWVLLFRGRGSNYSQVVFDWTGGALDPKEYLLLAGASYSGSALKDGTLAGTIAIAANGGSVQLRTAVGDAGEVVDSVGYGISTYPLAEGAELPLPLPGNSLARVPNGVDTDNNVADFTETSSPTPRAMNPGGAQ